ALVVIKRGALAFVSLGSAVGFVLAVERTVLILFDGPVDIVADEKIELAVFVVVEPGSAGRKTGIANAGFAGHIGKFSITEIAKEMVGPNAGDVDVDVSIIVVISNR